MNVQRDTWRASSLCCGPQAPDPSPTPRLQPWPHVDVAIRAWGMLLPADPQWCLSGGSGTPLGRQQASRLVSTSNTATAGTSLLPSLSTLAVHVTKHLWWDDRHEKRSRWVSDGRQAAVTPPPCDPRPSLCRGSAPGRCQWTAVSARAPLILTPTKQLARRGGGAVSAVEHRGRGQLQAADSFV